MMTATAHIRKRDSIPASYFPHCMEVQWVPMALSTRACHQDQTRIFRPGRRPISSALAWAGPVRASRRALAGEIPFSRSRASSFKIRARSRLDVQCPLIAPLPVIRASSHHDLKVLFIAFPAPKRICFPPHRMANVPQTSGVANRPQGNPSILLEHSCDLRECSEILFHFGFFSHGRFAPRSSARGGRRLPHHSVTTCTSKPNFLISSRIKR